MKTLTCFWCFNKYEVETKVYLDSEKWSLTCVALDRENGVATFDSQPRGTTGQIKLDPEKIDASMLDGRPGKVIPLKVGETIEGGMCPECERKWK